MSGYRFPLQKALDWRKTQLDLAEVRFRQQLSTLADLDRVRAEWEASGIRAETEVRKWSPVSGGDLMALGSYRLRVKSQERDIAARRAECQQEVKVREQAMLEARRRCRLLERLKERRLAEWQQARDKDLEELAAESFLAQWNRRKANNQEGVCRQDR